MSYAQLTGHAADLELDYSDEVEESWAGSPFLWIKNLAPRTKGAVGVRLAQRMMADQGVVAQRVGSGLRVGSQKVITKLSLEWTSGGFKFEQFRNDLYDYVFCLGLRPATAYGWLIPKAEVFVDETWQERMGFTGQHRGDAAQDTFWLSVNPEQAPAWLLAYGGPLPVLESRIALLNQG